MSPKTQRKSLDFRLKYSLAGHQARTLVYACTLTVESKGLNIKKKDGIAKGITNINALVDRSVEANPSTHGHINVLFEI